MSVWKAAVLWSGGLLLSGWAASVQAQTCEANADCPKGFTCEMTGGSSCGSPGCTPGEKCPDPPPCENTVYRSCVPGPCAVDSDCADGMVCYEQKIQACSGGLPVACMRGAACPEPAPPVCTDQSTRSCVPRYLLPCTNDTSCGPGFTCQEEESCSCAGSSGSAQSPPPNPGLPTPPPDAGSNGSGSAEKPPAPAIDGGQAPTDPAAAQTDAGVAVDGGSPMQLIGASCECHPSGQKSCQLNEIACKQSADCPAHFTCEASAVTNVTPVSCVAAPGADAAVCDTTPPQPPEPVVQRCVPPYADAVRHSGLGVVGKADSASSGSGPQPVATGAPGSASGGTSSATSPPANPSDAANEAHAKACSVAFPGANPASRDLTWLAASCAALALTWLRRRRG
jgi:hypothetical protein